MPLDNMARARISAEDARDLATLARHRGTTPSEALRAVLREAVRNATDRAYNRDERRDGAFTRRGPIRGDDATADAAHATNAAGFVYRQSEPSTAGGESDDGAYNTSGRRAGAVTRRGGSDA